MQRKVKFIDNEISIENGYLCFSELITLYEKEVALNNAKKQNLQLLTKNDSFLEKLHFAVFGNVPRMELSEFTKTIKEEGLFTVLKKFSAFKTTGARETKKSWALPAVWSAFAMELSPRFYAAYIINGAELSCLFVPVANKALILALNRINVTDIKKVVQAINEIVTGSKTLKFDATEKQLKEISEIEKFAAGLIECDYISSEQQLFSHLEMVQKKKQNISLNP